MCESEGGCDSVWVDVRMYARCSGNKCHKVFSFIDGENAKSGECLNCPYA